MVNLLLTEGYPSLNITVLTPISEKESAKFLPTQQEISAIKLEIKQLKNELENSIEEEMNFNTEIGDIIIENPEEIISRLDRIVECNDIIGFK